MNGLSAHQPPVGVPLATHVNPGGAPRVSPALLRGARELTMIFEQRTAKIKGELEEKIRVLTQERDAALVQASGHSQEAVVARVAQELRLERDTWLQERSQWDQERSQFERERSQWTKEREIWEQERAKWAEEKSAFAQEREARRALEQQVEVLKNEKEELKEAISSMLGAAARVQSGEMQQGGSGSLRENDANQRYVSVLEAVPQAHSPARSTTLQTLASSSTLSTLKSPSQEPVPMQLDSPIPLPAPSPKSPRVPVQARASPFPAQSSITAGDSSSRSPGVAGGPSGSQTAASTSKSPKWKLVIRIPPSNEPPRRLIKPPLTPPAPEESMEVIHWPRPPPSDDEGGGEDDPATVSETS
ncbi:hypothetical protein C8T65DRAFT_632825 [Cerioporus squamosus]|nr:hypothetical protein C8T65DRAFT_632825 [Cerioporus squamosus]